MKHKGLYCIGHVKTAHRECPKKFMKEHEYQQRGDHCVATANSEGVQLRCVGWNEGKRKKGRITPNVYVGSCRTTIDGVPHMKTRYVNLSGRTSSFGVPIPRPKMVATYHEHCGKIDDHNQLGQGVLGLEYRRTRRWDFRFFQTFIRFCMVDAFLAHRKFSTDTDDDNSSMSLLEFTHHVLDGLLDNVEGVSASAAPSRPAGTAPVADGGGGAAAVHAEQPLQNAVYFQRNAREREADGSPVMARARLTCRMCRKLTSTFSATCTFEVDGSSTKQIVALCQSRNRNCFVRYHEQLEEHEDAPPRARVRQE